MSSTHVESLTTAVPALEAQARRPGLSPRAHRRDARAGRVPVRQRGPRVHRSHLWRRRGLARAREPGAGANRCRAGADTAALARTCSSIPTRDSSPTGSPSMSGLDRTFFCNSGTEGMEACLKFARRYWYTAGEKGRTRIVALEGAFHGRTMGSLSVTADPHYRDPFAPLLADVTFVPANDVGGHRGRRSPPTRPRSCSRASRERAACAR